MSFNIFTEIFSNLTVQNHDDCKKFLDKIKTPVLTSEKANICEGDLVETELMKSLSSMQDYKSLGNDRLTEEFYEHFLNVIKIH